MMDLHQMRKKNLTHDGGQGYLEGHQETKGEGGV